MNILQTVFYFIIVIGILVTFHEFGHFWVARKLGVKVLRFSVGFGPIIARYQRHPETTEYVIAAIPFGGYVKMVDEREASVTTADLPYAFNRQPVLARSAIVAAGPIANLLLAIGLYTVVLMLGEMGMRPLVGDIQRGSLAFSAGFHSQDEIIEVNQQTTPTWSLAIEQIFSQALETDQPIEVKVKNYQGSIENHQLAIPLELAQHPEQLYLRLGLTPWSPPIPAIIETVLLESAAERAGLRSGDRIIQADNLPIQDWQQWVNYVKSRANSKIVVKVKRGLRLVSLTVVPQAVSSEDHKVEGKIGASVHISAELLQQLRVNYALPLPQAIIAATKQTYHYAWLSLRMMGKMLIGKASTDNLSGPISIAQYAGQSAEMGLVPFLKFLALISVSLGILNLLPIPMLDGGHLLWYLLEALKGSPVSDRIQFAFQQLGMVLLMSLMFLSVFLDIGRLFK
ncbi:MAG: hypothetical protein RL637_1570 [Pseudomonadota bacterium]|jgi:regulator of sigma E protease